MKIIILEDEAIYAGNLEMLVEKIGHVAAGIADNATDFLRIWRTTKPDLALVDININGSMNGIEVARNILNSDSPIPIIFITSLRDEQTFEEAQRLMPVAYIVKPFDQITLQRTIELTVYKYMHNSWEAKPQPTWIEDIGTPDFFFVKLGNILEKISTNDIAYAKVNDKYSEICLANKKHTVKMSLNDLSLRLGQKGFVRVHRNYLVNLHHIEQLHLKNNLLRVGGEDIPVSNTYREDLMKRLNQLL